MQKYKNILLLYKLLTSKYSLDTLTGIQTNFNLHKQYKSVYAQNVHILIIH